MAITHPDVETTEAIERRPGWEEGADPAAPDAIDADDRAEPASAPAVAVGAASTVWHNPDLVLEGRVARSAVIGAAIGIVSFVIVIGGLGLWVGLDLPGAAALGVFTAFWGGLGFGGMVGAVRAINQAEARRG